SYTIVTYLFFSNLLTLTISTLFPYTTLFRSLPDLNKMIRLYSQALMLIGYSDSDALREYGMIYAERKMRQAEIKESTEGTGVMKIGRAHVETYDLRKREIGRAHV